MKKLKELEVSYLPAPKEMILEEAKRFWTRSDNHKPDILEEDIYKYAQGR